MVKRPVTLALAAVVLLSVAGVTWWMMSERSGSTRSVAPTSSPEDADRKTLSRELPGTRSIESPSKGIRFENVAQESGIDFSYYGSPSADHYMTEQNGGGIAVLDYDADGIVDLFFSNGSHFTRPAHLHEASSTLYRAELPLEYEDTTSQAMLWSSGFGQGCAAGDYDNDGFTDLSVCVYGKNQLWRNNGDGTFTDVTDVSGAGDERWATSAAFADLNGDGLLDLYVVNYVDWTPDAAPCFLDEKKEQRKVCSPLDFSGQPDLILQNSGAGHFVPIEEFRTDGKTVAGKGLAVAIVDLNADDMLDVFVANDTMQNFLFVNQRDFRFQETAVSEGVAFSQDGTLGSSMGIAVGDYDRNSYPDLFVTNFAHEVIDAIANFGPGGFIASNAELRLDASSTAVLNFGIVMADFDLDQWPDLFFANGHLWDSGPGGDEYRMRPNVLKNHEGRFFRDVSRSAGDYFRERWLGRSVAAGDLDNDGDTDLVVAQLSDPAAVLENRSERRGRSIRTTFIGTRTCRQPLGCRVDVQLDDGVNLATHIPSGESFQAAHDSRVVLSVGNAAQIERISIHWPGGTLESWSALPCDGNLVLIEGTGMREERRID